MCVASSVERFRLRKLIMMRMLLQIRQHKANEMVLSECFIQGISIDAYQSLTPEKIVIITFQVPIALLTIGSTSSRDEAFMHVSWFLHI
jgi:hypothetical protein